MKGKKLMNTVIVIFVIALLFVGWSVFGKAIMAFYYNIQAEIATKDGRADQVVILLEKQLEQSPKDYSLRMDLVDKLITMGIYSRAEYHLVTGLSQTDDPKKIYQKLSNVYVIQDKLYDAVELLNNIVSPRIAPDVQELRPLMPIFSHETGTYNEEIELAITAEPNCKIYVSWDGEIPSIVDGLYSQPKKLTSGTTNIRAIAVNAQGFVSNWAEQSFFLENINYVVNFKDPAIESAVRHALGQTDGELYSNDLVKVTEIVVDAPTKYTTLEDLLELKSLTKLKLVGTNEFVDITSISYLSTVTDLALQNFHIDSVDLEVIGEMTWLSRLSLQENRIASLEPLVTITELTYLNISNNSLLDITAVSKMTHLQELHIAENAVQDLSALSELSSLKSIDVSHNGLVSLTGLENSAALEILMASNNNILDISAINNCTNLIAVNVSFNKLESVGTLDGLKKLTTLNLSNNVLANVSGLTLLTAVQMMDLSHNEITTIEGLRSCAALSNLDISKNQLKNVDELKSHPALSKINLDSNNVASIASLKTCSKLTEIYAFFNPLTDKADTFAGTAIKVHRT